MLSSFSAKHIAKIKALSMLSVGSYVSFMCAWCISDRFFGQIFKMCHEQNATSHNGILIIAND